MRKELAIMAVLLVAISGVSLMMTGDAEATDGQTTDTDDRDVFQKIIDFVVDNPFTTIMLIAAAILLIVCIFTTIPVFAVISAILLFIVAFNLLGFFDGVVSFR